MQFKAACRAVVGFNGIVKVLLTIESKPESQDEHLLVNILKSRGELKQDKNYLISIMECVD